MQIGFEKLRNFISEWIQHMARERRGYRAKFQKSTTIENVNL